MGIVQDGEQVMCEVVKPLDHTLFSCSKPNSFKQKAWCFRNLKSNIYSIQDLKELLRNLVAMKIL